jgi:hypothetical protein
METIIFGIAIALGIVPALIWSRIGGDERFKNRRPIIIKLLKMIHHWEIGIVLMGYGMYSSDVFIFGLGLGTYLDDTLFHSFESYFKRKSEP